MEMRGISFDSERIQNLQAGHLKQILELVTPYSLGSTIISTGANPRGTIFYVQEAFGSPGGCISTDSVSKILTGDSLGEIRYLADFRPPSKEDIYWYTPMMMSSMFARYFLKTTGYHTRRLKEIQESDATKLGYSSLEQFIADWEIRFNNIIPVYNQQPNISHYEIFPYNHINTRFEGQEYDGLSVVRHDNPMVRIYDVEVITKSEAMHSLCRESHLL